MRTFLAALVLLSTPTVEAQIAIRGETVYTMAGRVINDGVVVITGRTIEKVGQASNTLIPEGYRVLTAKVVTPGLVDAHSVVGLAGILNYRHDQMQFDKSEPMQPELRAIDAYNPQEALVEWVRNFGVTTMHTGHAPGALASGTTIVVKTTGATVNEALVDSVGMVAFTFGSSVSDNFSSPGTRSKAAAMMRAELLKAREHMKKQASKDPDKRPSPDLRLDMLARVLRGEVVVLFTAQRANDIQTALRLQQEFGFRTVLDGAAEAYLVLEDIKKAGVPVVLHPTMVRHYGDTRNVSFETAAKLHEAGILFAIQSGYEGYVPKARVLLFEAGVASAYGLPLEATIASITINPARILGLEKRIGSLEPGKDADVVLFDGDPFEYTTHVCGVIVNGVLVSETCR